MNLSSCLSFDIYWYSLSPSLGVPEWKLWCLITIQWTSGQVMLMLLLVSRFSLTLQYLTTILWNAVWCVGCLGLHYHHCYDTSSNLILCNSESRSYATHSDKKKKKNCLLSFFLCMHSDKCLPMMKGRIIRSKPWRGLGYLIYFSFIVFIYSLYNAKGAGDLTHVPPMWGVAYCLSGHKAMWIGGNCRYISYIGRSY